MGTMVLNQAQREILDVMSCLSKEEDLKELKQLLVAFLNKCLQKELDALWDNGTLSEEELATYRHEHLRTKYQ